MPNRGLTYTQILFAIKRIILLVLYNCYSEEVNKIAEKIKQTIERPFDTPYGEINITISMGIYMTRKPEAANSSLLKADKALYYVKNHGKA